jgi:hypothetical protein
VYRENVDNVCLFLERAPQEMIVIPPLRSTDSEGVDTSDDFLYDVVLKTAAHDLDMPNLINHEVTVTPDPVDAPQAPPVNIEVPVHEFHSHVSRSGRAINPPARMQDYYAIDAIYPESELVPQEAKETAILSSNHKNLAKSIYTSETKIMDNLKQLQRQIEENFVKSSQQILKIEMKFNTLDSVARDADFQARICAGHIDQILSSLKQVKDIRALSSSLPILLSPIDPPELQSTQVQSNSKLGTKKLLPSTHKSKIPVANWHFSSRNSFSI